MFKFFKFSLENLILCSRSKSVKMMWNASYQKIMLSDDDLIALVRCKCFDFEACAKEIESHSSLTSDDVRLNYAAIMKRRLRVNNHNLHVSDDCMAAKAVPSKCESGLMKGDNTDKDDRESAVSLQVVANEETHAGVEG
mmetsp:Transcript_16228/g.25321  ORF Transcript_16228/g.25321 Transcript_16228/m.25321 type:complete len:139 (+) Transcript_16228:5535-5951(+)